MGFEMEDPISTFLRAANELNVNGEPDDFSLVYRKLEGFPDKDAPKGKLVRERLGFYLTPARCASLLVATYPSEMFTREHAERTYEIFRIIVEKCTHREMENDEEVEFGFEAYYSPGFFQIKRSKVLQDLLNAPEVEVLCFDINQNKGPRFKLIQLLRDEEAFETFQETWGKLPGYDFSKEDEFEELEVNIVRMECVLEETAKMNENLLSSLQNMTDDFKGMAEHLTERVENLKDVTIREQDKKILELRSRLTSAMVKGMAEHLTERVENLKDVTIREQDNKIIELRSRLTSAMVKTSTMIQAFQNREARHKAQLKKVRKRAKKATKKGKKTKRKLRKAKKKLKKCGY